MVNRVLILLGVVVVVVCMLCILVVLEWVSNSVPVCLWVVSVLDGLDLSMCLHLVVVLVQLFLLVK